jgi:hypothetical protein
MVDIADFTDLVSGSHTARFRAVLVEGFQDGEDPTGTELLLLNGEVEFDATADIRGTATIDIAADWPRARDLSLGPYGTEIALSRGVNVGSEGTIWAPLGYYRITSVSQDDAAKGPISLELEDRMSTIIDSRFLQPRQWEVGTTVGDIVDDIVLEIYPDATIVFDDDANLSQLGRSLIVEEDRYEGLVTLADGLGKIVFWDNEGRLMFQTAPDEDTPDWVVNAGPNGVMVEASRELTREGIYNAVVVNGEGADELTPVQAIAVNGQENSPTFFGGPFGRVPFFYASSFITTQNQAENAAVNLLRRKLGASYNVDLSAIPNPAVQPYIVIRVVYNDGTRELHIIEKATIPLNVDDALSIATRQSTIIHIGVN